MPRRAHHAGASVGVAAALESFQQQKEFLGKHVRGLFVAAHFNSLRRFQDGFVIDGKWFRGRARKWFSARARQICDRDVADDAQRGRRSGNCERDQARAKQDKAGHGHGEETVGSEFFTHGNHLS